MPLVKRFEDLQAWQEARSVTQRVYKLTQEPEFRRDYGLVDQVRRASVSVMNNIVEGFDSGSSAEFVRFLGYARRSGSEVQSCLYVALDQRYVSQTKFQEMYESVERARSLIAGFIRYLRQRRTGTSARTNVGTYEHTHAGTSERPHAGTYARTNVGT